MSEYNIIVSCITLYNVLKQKENTFKYLWAEPIANGDIRITQQRINTAMLYILLIIDV